MAAIDKTYFKSYEQYKEIADWCKAQGTVIDSFGNKITPYDYIPHMWEYKDDDDIDGIDKGEYTEEYVNHNLELQRKENSKKYKTEEYWKYCLDLYKDEDYESKYNTFDKWCDYVDTWAELFLWNTDHIFDIYLIKNCPVKFIQERLKEQYGGGWSKEAFTHNNCSYESIKNGTSIYDTYQRNGLKKPHFRIKYYINIPFKDNGIGWFIEVHSDDDYWSYDEVADKWYCYDECYMPKSHFFTSVSYYDYKGNMNKGRLKRLLSKWNLPDGCTVKFKGDYNGILVKVFDVKIKK